MTDCTFTHKGFTFDLDVRYDYDAPPPWESDPDMHGVIRDGLVHDRRDGERVLWTDYGRAACYYSIPKSVEKAAEQWFGRPADEEVRDAVEADFARLKAWADDEWHYQVMTVTLTIGGHTYTRMRGRMESDAETDEAMDVARELADEILDEAGEWDVCPCCKGEGRIKREGGR